MVLDDRRPGVIPLREMLRQAAAMPACLNTADISGRFSQTLLDLLVLSLELQDLNNVGVERDLYSRMMNSHPAATCRSRFEHRKPGTGAPRFQFAPSRVLSPAIKNADGSDLAGEAAGEPEAIECGRVSSVSQAALDFGFSDFSHFSHAFRKAFGISPRSLLPKKQ
ncbi:helix-turn-helix domain-containing protein [Klebsiella variicola subsp. variicola]|nr:helix-turn-helix domain-containing protein [Klebsiella variicola subsp. variicola]